MGNALVDTPHLWGYTRAAVTRYDDALAGAELEEAITLSDADGSEKQKWLDGAYSRSTQRFPERDYPFETSDGQVVDPTYTSDDLAGWDDLKQLGLPG